MMLKKASNLSRRKMANPHQNKPLYQRLKSTNAIDLRNNRSIIDLNNGYSEIVPIDENKRFK
ncbi:hypothetical protein [Bacillus cereus]|uniref:hypothetical protein n=1 Tax=Bacillus cereus group TaxID=86661 RepID=UPI00211D6A9A|nr:hypothetical protein [Bacillus cereus]